MSFSQHKFITKQEGVKPLEQGNLAYKTQHILKRVFIFSDNLLHKTPKHITNFVTIQTLQQGTKFSL